MWTIDHRKNIYCDSNQKRLRTTELDNKIKVDSKMVHNIAKKPLQHSNLQQKKLKI